MWGETQGQSTCRRVMGVASRRNPWRHPGVDWPQLALVRQWPRYIDSGNLRTLVRFFQGRTPVV